MFTLKFYRPKGGYEIHQAHTVDILPWDGDNNEGNIEPKYQVMFEDSVANCLTEKLIGTDQFEHYDSLIVENMNGKTTEILRA